MKKPSFTLGLLACCALGVACGDVGGPQVPFVPTAFATLDVEPSSTDLVLTVVDSVQLTITARDGTGAVMPAEGVAEFSSSAPDVAEVSGGGLVTAVAAGTAAITATLTMGRITRTAVMNVTVSELADNVTLTSGDRGWEPAIAHVKVGGLVTWTVSREHSWDGVPQRAIYIYPRDYWQGLEVELIELALIDRKASHTFDSPGDFHYCSGGCWDSPDWGIIHVH